MARAMLLALVASASLLAQAQELFSNQAANPSAVQFRHVRAVDGAVCGEVNKPNRQGGYNGFQRFVYRSKYDWAIEWAGDYRLAEAGRYTDTELLSAEADREERWDITRATDILSRANAARSRASELMKTCD